MCDMLRRSIIFWEPPYSGVKDISPHFKLWTISAPCIRYRTFTIGEKPSQKSSAAIFQSKNHHYETSFWNRCISTTNGDTASKIEHWARYMHQSHFQWSDIASLKKKYFSKILIGKSLSVQRSRDLLHGIGFDLDSPLWLWPSYLLSMIS